MASFCHASGYTGTMNTSPINTNPVNNAASLPDTLDPAQCYTAMQAHDTRFDGVFFVGVVSTGVYCRPVCRVRLPRRENCRFYTHAAAAEHAGYRPCLKCRPELAPGHSTMEAVDRLAQRAAERIRAGALTDSSLESLAEELAISSRQLRRAVEQSFGVSPLQLAQTCRLLLAKQLLTDTPLKIADIAFASGFSSLRRFNDAFKKHYRLNPTGLRKQRDTRPGNGLDDGTVFNDGVLNDGIVLNLGYRPPLDWQSLIHFLCSRGACRTEQFDGDTYCRSLSINGTAGWLTAQPHPKRHQVQLRLSSSLLPHLQLLQSRLRQLFDLDANPASIEQQLSRDKTLKPLVARSPGLRVPGTVDFFELALRAVLGQQVSVKAATTLFNRFTERFGDTIQTPFPGVDRTPPNPAKIARARVSTLIGLGLTERRANTIRELAKQFHLGQLPVPGAPQQTQERLLAISGIGPWTCEYFSMRALRDPNAIPLADLGLMKALGVSKPAEVETLTRHWQPWRAYGALYLWQSLGNSKGG